jgi:hypothetical protein
VSAYKLVESSHKAEPIAGSFYTRLGRPANLFRSDHYPVEAVCSVCSKPIVVESFLREFSHFSRD